MLGEGTELCLATRQGIWFVELFDREVFGLEGFSEGFGFAGADGEAKDTAAAVFAVTQLKVADVDLAGVESPTDAGQLPWFVFHHDEDDGDRRGEGLASFARQLQAVHQGRLIAGRDEC